MRPSKQLSNILFLALIFIATVSPLRGKGWTQPQGSFYLKLDTRITVADEFYEPGGKKVKITTLGDYTFSLYGEYGLTDEITVFTYFPFFKHITLNKIEGSNSGFEYFQGDEKNGIADTDLGIRYRMADFGSTVISVVSLFGLPLGDNNQENGLLTGDGEFNQMLSFEVGHSLYPLNAYLIGDIGFNNRINGYSDELRYGLEFGYTFWNRLLVILRATGVEPLRNGDDSVKGGSGGLFANNQKYLMLGPEINCYLSGNFGISAAVSTATHAENVLSALAYQFGIYYTD